YGDYSFFSDNWSSKARNWLPTVDHPYEKAMNELIVTAPAHLQVISNGVLIEESVTENGDRLTHWKNSVPIATWLYVVGVSPFAVQYVDTFDGKSIQTWVYRQDRDAGFYDFAVPSKQVLTFYSDLIGPYSYEKLANFVSAATGGGMEAASAVAYGERSVTGERSTRWQNVIIHEIAHQWFGNSVTEHEWNHVWLSEGFATYYTLLYREYANGRDDFVDGLINSRDRVFAYYEDDYDFQLIRDELGDLDDISGAMMYQRGAWTLHMLREMIGVDAYNAGVRNYYSEYQNKTALTGDFRRHMEEISGLDLSGFFGQWLYQGGVPVLEGSWSVDDGQLTIVMAQIQEKYEFDLTVDFGISYKDGSYERISIGIAPGQPSVRSTPVEKEVLNIVVDPDTRVLARWTFERK
ncbi:MAG: M1 family peptidase, partial [Bacteroidetes bacterium]